MNYRKIYIKIIKKALSENRKKIRNKNNSNYIYYENHHILPKSLFPKWKNRKSNLVLLTAREHFFCHQLLIKIYNGSEMYNALWRMSIDKKHKVTSKEYEKLKINRSKLLSEKQKGKSRSKFSNNWKENIRKSRIGTTNSIESKIKVSNWSKKCNWYNNGEKETFSQNCPAGWKKGRIFINGNRVKVKCIELNIIFNSMYEAAQYIGIKSSPKIGEVCRGLRKSIGGYTWEYVN